LGDFDVAVDDRQVGFVGLAERPRSLEREVEVARPRSGAGHSVLFRHVLDEEARGSGASRAGVAEGEEPRTKERMWISLST
jgi:hypothetical protein